MKNYLNNIKQDFLNPRLIYGFAYLRAPGKIKYFNQRWLFLISSRPLNFEQYISDSKILDEQAIPPLLELETIYIYIMGNEGDTSSQCGEIKTVEIINIT
jgi:hypothetical protein